MNKAILALPVAALLAACGGGGGGSGAGQQIKIVGSSTVYPFTTAVAEAFQRENPQVRVTVESTGTGSGIKLFCSGIGSEYPDLVNASRPMKRSEYDSCAASGARQVIELPIGIDGIVLIESNQAQPMSLTVRDIYAALAANPFGRPQTARTWRDVNPSLPDEPIRVLGPAPTSGTRDSFAELMLVKGCETDPAMKALKASNSDRHEEICTQIRQDGAYVEQGENDNLLVQKVAADPGTLAVLGYSYLAENAERVRPVEVGGVLPTEQTIANLQYPGARRLYVYAKGEHLQAKPVLREFLGSFAQLWGSGGLLEQRGLVPFAGADAAAANAQATALTPLDPAKLK